MLRVLAQKMSQEGADKEHQCYNKHSVIHLQYQELAKKGENKQKQGARKKHQEKELAGIKINTYFINFMTRS